MTIAIDKLLPRKVVAAPRLVIVGPLPPPMGGAARITGAIREALEQRGTHVITLDTSARTLSHSRSAAYHLGRVARTLMLITVLAGLSIRRRSYYLVPDGGLGVWYSLALVMACTFRCERLVVHHHTCRYVEERDLAMCQITKRTHRVAEHVFLTPGMASAFEQMYGKVPHRIVGNAAFTHPAEPEAPRSSGTGLVLGHLSNLCREKGFHEACDTFEAIAEFSDDAILRLAGPILEHDVTDRLQRLRSRYGRRIEYLGPLHGAAKTEFYNGIDVFLFPTQFRQEAAPNVLYEAAASGTPTVAVARGQVEEILLDLHGTSCSSEDDYPAFARRVLDSMDRAELSALRTKVRSSFVAAHRRDYTDLESLLALLEARPPCDS